MAFDSQSPIHKTKIDFDNWFAFQKTNAEQIKDPLDNQFDWWYWCGFKSKEEKDNAILKYNEFKSMLPTNLSQILRSNNLDDKTKLLVILKKAAIKDGETDEYVETLFNSMTQLAVDIPRSGKPLEETGSADKIYEMCFNVMFAIYSIELKKNIYDDYLQGESFMLVQILSILLDYKDKSEDEIECLLYHIYHTLLFKLHIKKMIFTMPRDITQMSSNNGKIPHFVFFNWLFIVMFIKKNKNKFKKLINGKNKKEIDDMFSETISRGSLISWYQKIHLINKTDFKEIIGNVLVNKSTPMFFAYMISYWSNYAKKQGELWDDIDFDRGDNNLSMFWDRYAKIKSEKLFKQSLIDINDDFDSIYGYFKEHFEKVVLNCTRESFTNITISSFDTQDKYYKWNFKLPRKFIKNNKIWDVKYTDPIHDEKVAQIGAIMGGRRKNKKIIKKSKTLKKSNKKFNRSITLR
uniref:Uncharacterized protein n=1 Tax=viral metagenome TaxID=1070528 RepID=A0A6C0JCI0_9ZZZZ